LFGPGKGRHIVGWDPAPAKGMFTTTDFMSVSNMFAASGLQVLADLATVAERKANASKFAKISKALKASILKKMWSVKDERFCDGVCAEAPSHGIYSDMYIRRLLV